MLLFVWCAACSAPAIPWGELQNPLLTRDEAVKDAYAVHHEGTWHLGYSFIAEDPFRFRVGFSTTDDWQSFEHLDPIDDPTLGGLASPNVARSPGGEYVLTYNSHTHDVDDTRNKLYYRTSEDLRTWSEPKRIHVEGADGPDDRLIDAALAFADSGTYLFFKLEQAAHVAHSASGSVDGPWTLLGRLEPDTLENIQALKIDGTWHILGTTIPLVHRPALLRLDGDESSAQAWLRWKHVTELEIPEEGWNTGGEPWTYERSNAAFMIDQRAEDEHYYLLYAGSTETVRFSGRGHSSLGLARSRDLVTWEIPPRGE